jgi:hypothetical protein
MIAPLPDDRPKSFVSLAIACGVSIAPHYQTSSDRHQSQESDLVADRTLKITYN